MEKPQRMIEEIMESRNNYRPNYTIQELKKLMGYIIKKTKKSSKTQAPKKSQITEAEIRNANDTARKLGF